MKLLEPRTNKYIPWTPYAKQKAFLILDCKEAFYGGAAGGGKAQPLDAEVMTPFGPRTMGDMKIGSTVSNPDGTNSRVIATHDVGKKDVYEIIFKDGGKCRVAGDHLWKYTTGDMKGAWEHSLWKIATTEQIIDYLNRRGFDSKIHVPVPDKPIEFTKSYKYEMRKIDPYVLGAFIGDGCLSDSRSHNRAGITSMDYPIIKRISKAGIKLKKLGKKGKAYDYVVKDNGSFVRNLKRIELWGTKSKTKFIPIYYKLSSIKCRKALIKGLMDTDGYIDETNCCYYYTISKRLAEDVQWIINSLGGVASIKKSPAWYKDKNGNRKYCNDLYTVYIRVRDSRELFHLDRKKARGGLISDKLCGKYVLKRTIDTIEKLDPQECKCITVENTNGLYMTNDFIVTHNSVTLLFAAAQYVDVPGYNALLLRDSFANLSKPEGLIDLSFDWFIKSDAKWSENKKRWTFPSGATINFGHMDGPKAHFQYQSSSYHFIGIDEVVQIPRNQALYLFSRLRKTKNIEVPNRFRCASNPPTAEQMSTGAWVKERYVDPDTREEDVVFIPALMEDNPFLDTEDYDESLEKLDPVTRMQLRFGDWNVSVKGRMFERDWITGNVVNEPFGEIKDRIRYWDLASTEPSKRNRDPDFTAGVLMSINKNKDIFIEHIEHFREMPGTTERRVRRMAIRDGIGTDQVIERDPGGAGKALFAHYKRDVLFGYNTREGGISGSKAERAKPFSSHCMDGKVFLVRGPWIKNYLNELELFPDGPHDDMCDGSSGAFFELAGAIRVEFRARWV